MILLAACVPAPDTTRALDPRVPVLLRDGQLALISITRIADSAVASPESLRHHMEVTYWPLGTRARIARRSNIPDGFFARFELAAGDEVDVIRQIGRLWWRCSAGPVDKATSDAAIVAYCRDFNPAMLRP